MNSLKVKILGLMAVIMVMAVTLTVWHNLNTQHAMLDRIAEQNGRVIGETIRNSIANYMANGQNKEVRQVLESLGKEQTIAAVKIFDESGRILASASREEIGDLIGTSDLLAYRAQKSSFTEQVRGVDLFKTIIPIHNAPACFGCHDQNQKTLGVLDVHLSLKDLEALQNEGRRATIVSSLAMLGILIVVISAFILFYVDAPIRRIIAAMDHVEQGNFNIASIAIDSSVEMGQLADRFNRMVDRLKQLVDNTVRHEREMAVAQEQLQHHDAIRDMNNTLEERLKEIEYLNISLEERIEEIEEANYKIADLAGDLENKNTTLERAVGRLSALYRMGLAINSTMELEKLFDLLLRKAMETVNARIGYILLLDRDSWTLRIGGAIGIPHDFDQHQRIPLKPGGVSHWVIENRQPMLIQNIADSRDFSRISRLGFARETVVCAPLTIKDEVIGTVTLANKFDGTAFTPDDLDLLSTIAAQASVAIKNARLYEEQQSTYLSTVQALVSAVEASDPYTRGHSERVTRIALALGRSMELPGEVLKRLEHASVLHDIGKIGIDVALLHKKDKLTSTDVQTLQQHPLIGVRILEPIVFLKGVREIIGQHHERFDGAGYPYALAGEAILIEARIMAVADTYDAMTSDRPYRKALSHETAIQEILDHAGSQFDPQVAHAFVNLCRSGSLHS